jgi:shikimate kinase
MTARGIYLIGFSGTGKSTVAQLVGAQLGWPAHDIDRIIAEVAGIDIPGIFAQEGEAGFREREAAALRSIAQAGAFFVAATGGGLPLREENRELMGRTGWVIALEGRPETLHARLQRQREAADPEAARPLLAASSLEHLRAMKERRQAIYALADWTVHTDRLSPEQAAGEVVRAREILERHEKTAEQGRGLS